MINSIINSDKLKLKNTSLLWVIISLPLLVLAYELANFFFRYEYIMKLAEMFHSNSMWDYLIYDNSMILGLGVPLSITVITSIICNIDHQSNAWKQILSLPVNKGNIYISKILLLIASLIISAFVLAISMLIVGLAFQFKGPIPWKVLLGDCVAVYMTSFPIMALQLWFSMIMKNQALPITIGALSSMMGMFLAMNTKLRWLFWAYPIQASTITLGQNGLLDNPDLLIFIIGSFIFGCIFFILGTFHFVRKDL